jgi:hypothetical protein
MKRPSAPLAISVAALFFALTGAGLAATATTSAGKTTNAYGAPVTMCAKGIAFRKCIVGDSSALCPPGTVVTGGGWVNVKGQNYTDNASVVVNGPQSNFAWVVQMDNNDSFSGSFRAVAICTA